MASPKSMYSFRLSDAAIKKIHYCGNKLRNRSKKPENLTGDLEATIDQMYAYLKEGPELFR